MGKQPIIAKITAPKLAQVAPRLRLFGMLDQSSATVTWITGPAGSGKTTLAASWLVARKIPCLWYRLDEGDSDLATFFYYMGLAGKKAAPRYKRPLPHLIPEYALGVPAFTRRYFEELFHRLVSSHTASSRPDSAGTAALSAPAPPGCIIVLDNYHEVLEDSPFHGVIRQALSDIPQGVNVIVLSRGDAPVSFADLRAKNNMMSIGWEELRFTVDESLVMLQKQNKRISRDVLNEIHEKTQGWAAGLVLMTGGLATSGTLPQRELSQEKIFDYFAGEILSRLDAETRDFLVMSSVLPDMTVQNAVKLTGNNRAGQILSRLNRQSFFTEKHGAPVPFFRYHPLFRDFLQTLLQETHDPEGVVRLQRQAAGLLEGSGQTDDAASLFIESRDWQGLTTLVLQHATRLLAQGRYGPLEAWIRTMPWETVENTPWLLYWKGLCRLPFSPREGRDYFEKAFRGFEAVEDAAGVFLAWTGIVESIQFSFENMGQLDVWIDRLPVLIRAYGFPSQKIETRVASAMVPILVMRQPSHRDFEFWQKKALAEDEVDPKINTLFHVAFHYGYRGYFAQASATVEECRKLAETRAASLLSMLKLRLIEQITLSLTGSYESGNQLTREGLQIAERSGIHILDPLILGNGALRAMNNDDMTFARTCLQRMNALYEHLSPWDRTFYHILTAVEAKITGDLHKARFHAESAFQYATQVDTLVSNIWCRYQNAVILYAVGERQKAEALLEEGESICRSIGSILGRYEYYLVKAQFSMERGDKKGLVSYLRQAMALGSRQGIFNTFNLWRQLNMTKLVVTALENQIEVAYVQELIRWRHIVPDEPPLHIENWPWPVRIFTLGAFKVFLDDKPVSFNGKVQKKPLEMLKAIVASGANDVREDHLTDMLWPDAEGDAAAATCRSTLHRLRQLIGHERAIVVHEGRVSLNPSYCWTDSWAFERLVESPGPGLVRSALKDKAGKLSTADSRSERTLRLEKAMQLYKGHFLADDEQPWTAFLRERLKNKFLRAVDELGEQWMIAGEPKKAMQCYEKGLEIDDLSEEFYRRLMACNLSLGRKAEAIKIYDRCKKALLTGLGVGPSSETEALYRSIERR
jgi:LuxR family maltose regulon positive regulatory protein